MAGLQLQQEVVHCIWGRSVIEWVFCCLWRCSYNCTSDTAGDRDIVVSGTNQGVQTVYVIKVVVREDLKSTGALVIRDILSKF